MNDSYRIIRPQRSRLQVPTKYPVLTLEPSFAARKTGGLAKKECQVWEQ